MGAGSWEILQGDTDFKLLLKNAKIFHQGFADQTLEFPSPPLSLVLYLSYLETDGGVALLCAGSPCVSSSPPIR